MQDFFLYIYDALTFLLSFGCMNIQDYDKSVIQFKGQKVVVVFEQSEKLENFYNYSASYPQINIKDVLSYDNYPKSILRHFTDFDLHELYDEEKYFEIVNNKIEEQ